MGAQQSAGQEKGQEGGLDMLGMCCRSDPPQEQGGGRRRDQGVLPFALTRTHSHSQHLFHGHEHRISSHHLPPSPPSPLSPFVPPHASSTQKCKNLLVHSPPAFALPMLSDHVMFPWEVCLHFPSHVVLLPLNDLGILAESWTVTHCLLSAQCPMVEQSSEVSSGPSRM